MFSKKAQTDVRKSAHKILDPKKDIATRFKHLKFLLGTYVYVYMCVLVSVFVVGVCLFALLVLLLVPLATLTVNLFKTMCLISFYRQQ